MGKDHGIILSDTPKVDVEVWVGGNLMVREGVLVFQVIRLVFKAECT